MKPRFFTLALIFLFIVLPVFLYAQYMDLGFGRSFQMEDINSVVVEDFETNDRNWQASASRFTADGFPQVKTGIEGTPLALARGGGSEENKYVLGVRAAFNRKEHNRIWIYPEEEIVIPGHAKKVNVWVWGANYHYKLEAHLRDYRGIVHKLPLGSLHFMGWRNMSVDIPNQIPQHVRYLPMEKPLSLVRLAIETEPTERQDDFIIYFDHLKVLTDMYRQRFDGDTLADTSREIWNLEGSNE